MASSSLRRRIMMARAVGNRRMSSSSGRRDEPSSPPWLMLPPSSSSSSSPSGVYKYYSLGEKRVVSRESSQSQWRESGEWEFVGSSHGWLALFNQPTNRLFLSNPISDRLINLPDAPERDVDVGRCRGRVSKIILSPSPDEEEEKCRVAMTYGPGNAMFFCSPFSSSSSSYYYYNKNWCPFGLTNFVEHPLYQPFTSHARVHEDLVYCGRRRVLNCVTPIEFDLDSFEYRGGEDVCKLDDWDIHHPLLHLWDRPKTTWPETACLSYFMNRISMREGENTHRWALEQQHCVQIPHLVYSDHLDQLYLVMRFVALVGPDGRHLRQVPHCPVRGLRARYPCQTVGFVVLKVYHERGLGAYHVADDLDGLAMFVGVNHSFVIPAARFPELKPNSIYFTDAKRLGMLDGVSDTGVFDYESKAISPIVIPDDDDPPPSSSPIWFYPSNAQ